MDVRLPNGQTLTFEGDVSEEDMDQAVLEVLGDSITPQVKDDTDASLPELFGRGVKSFGFGAVGSLGTLTGSESLKSFAEEGLTANQLDPRVYAPIKQTFEQEGFKEAVREAVRPGRLAFGMGNIIPQVATFVIPGGAVGKVAQVGARVLLAGKVAKGGLTVAKAAKVARGVGQAARVGTITTLGGTLEATGTFEEAKRRGFTKEEALNRSVQMGVAVGLLNALPFEFGIFKGLRSFNKMSSVGQRMLMQIGLTGFLEGTTEALEEPIEAGLLSKADQDIWEEMKDSFPAMIEVFFPAALSGGLFGLGGSLRQIDVESGDVAKVEETAKKVKEPEQTLEQTLINDLIHEIPTEQEIDKANLFGLLKGDQFIIGDEVLEDRGIKQIIDNVVASNPTLDDTIPNRVRYVYEALNEKQRDLLKEMGDARAEKIGPREMLGLFLMSQHMGDKKLRTEYRTGRAYLKEAFDKGMTLQDLTDYNGVFNYQTEMELKAKGVGKELNLIPEVFETGLFRENLPEGLQSAIRENFKGEGPEGGELTNQAIRLMFSNKATAEGTTIAEMVKEQGFGPLVVGGDQIIEAEGAIAAPSALIRKSLFQRKDERQLNFYNKSLSLVNDAKEKNQFNSEDTISKSFLRKKVLNEQTLHGDELNHVGLDEFLKSVPGSRVSREMLVDFLAANTVHLHEERIGDGITPEKESELAEIDSRLATLLHRMQDQEGLNVSDEVEKLVTRKRVISFGRTNPFTSDEVNLPGGTNHRVFVLTSPEVEESLGHFDEYITHEGDKLVGHIRSSEHEVSNRKIAREDSKVVDAQRVLNDELESVKISVAGGNIILAPIFNLDGRIRQLDVIELNELGNEIGFVDTIRKEGLSSDLMVGPTTKAAIAKYNDTLGIQKVFVIEELQSNLGAKPGPFARQAERVETLKKRLPFPQPYTPFQNSWQTLLLKHALTVAATEGYEQVHVIGAKEAARASRGLSEKAAQRWYGPNMKRKLDKLMREAGTPTVRATEGLANEPSPEGGGRNPVHVLKWTEKTRQNILDNGFSLFQKDAGVTRGVTQPVKVKDAIKYLIRALQSAAPDTGIHEFTHWSVLTSTGAYRLFLETEIPRALKSMGSELGKDFSVDKMSRKDHETLAKAATSYFFEGEASQDLLSTFLDKTGQIKGRQGKARLFRHKSQSRLFGRLRQEFLKAYAVFGDSDVIPISDEMRLLMVGMWGGIDSIGFTSKVTKAMNEEDSRFRAAPLFQETNPLADFEPNKNLDEFFAQARVKSISTNIGGARDGWKSGTGQTSVIVDSVHDTAMDTFGLNEKQMKILEADVRNLDTIPRVTTDDMEAIINRWTDAQIIKKMQSAIQGSGPIPDAYEAVAGAWLYMRMLMTAGEGMDPDAMFNDGTGTLKRVLDSPLGQGKLDRQRRMLLAGVQMGSNNAGRMLYVMRLAQLPQLMQSTIKKMGRNFTDQEFRMINSLFLEGGLEQYNQLVGYFKLLSDPTGVKKKIILTLLYNGMLSNPGTHGANAISNFFMGAYLIAHRGTQASVDAIMSKGERGKRRVFFGEAFEMIKAVMPGSGAFKKGMKLAKIALKTDFVFRILKGRGENVTEFEQALGQKVEPLPEEFVGFTTKWDQEMGYIDMALARIPIGKGGRKLLNMLTIPTRMLRASDLFFKAVAHEGEYAATILRIKELHKAGSLEQYRSELRELHRKELDFTPRQRELLLSDPGLKELKRVTGFNEDDVLSLAQHLRVFEEHSTFQDAPGKLTRNVTQFRETVDEIFPVLPVGRILVPFVHTIANLTKRGAELTPGLGIPAGLFVSKLSGREVFAKQAEALLIGGAMALLLWDMDDDELITGPPPKDKSKREALFRTGWQPYSFKVGDKYYAYNRIEPFGFPFGVVASIKANIIETLENNTDPAKERITWLQGLFRASSVLKDFAIDSSFMRGFTEFVREGETSVGRVAVGTLSNMLPYGAFFRSINNANMMDPEVDVREWTYPQLFAQNLPPGMFGIPGPFDVAKEVFEGVDIPKIDLFGNKVRRGTGPTFLREWMPIRVRTEQTDIVEEEFKKLGWYPGMPTRRVTVDHRPVRMEDDQYREYVLKTGMRIKPALEKVIRRPSYQRMKDPLRKTLLVRRVIERVHARELNKIRHKIRRQRRGLPPRISKGNVGFVRPKR